MEESLGIRPCQIPPASSTEIDPISVLPPEVAYMIFSKLKDPIFLNNSCLVSRRWNNIANDQRLWKQMRPVNTFGAKEWLEYLGADIDEEPPFPNDIMAIHKSLCPFTNKQKVWQTHALVLIPKTINGEQFNIENLTKCTKSKFERMNGQIGKNSWQTAQYIWEPLMKCSNTGESYWMLIKMTVLYKSRKKSYSDQQKLVELDGKGNYQIPNVVEAAAWVLLKYAYSMPKSTYGLNPWAYTRTQINIQNQQMVIGGCMTNGFIAGTDKVAHKNVGVMAVRKFS